METVFLSYATKDHFFAELLLIKLGESGINVWRDRGQLRAGTDWRQGIERGISESLTVLVALSAESSQSSYVTYEWAYAIGKGKPVIPLRLSECHVHPKLETIQYLDFSVSGALPWASLVERIREIETDADGPVIEFPTTVATPTAADAKIATAILAYLNERGYQMASFAALRARVEPPLSDQRYMEVVAKHPLQLRPATLRGEQPGLAKVVP